MLGAKGLVINVEETNLP